MVLPYPRDAGRKVLRGGIRVHAGVREPVGVLIELTADVLEGAAIGSGNEQPDLARLRKHSREHDFPRFGRGGSEPEAGDDGEKARFACDDSHA